MQNLRQIQAERLSPSTMLETESCHLPDSYCAETLHVCEEKSTICDSTESGSEVDLLESRLDEQTRLIMILKKSAEDSDAKCRTLENENQNLAQVRDTGERKLEKQARELSQLTEGVKTLQGDFDDISSIVKDLQSTQGQMTKERLMVHKEHERLYMLAKSESEKQVGALKQDHAKLRIQCVRQKRNISEEMKQIETRKKQYVDQIANQKSIHKGEIQNTMENLQVKKSAFKATEKALKKEEDLYMRDLPVPEDVLKLEVKNKNLHKKDSEIQREVLAEKWKTDDLRRLVNGLEGKVKELNTTFEQKAAESQAKELVQELHNKISGAEHQFEQTQEEIVKLKKEAQEKLQEERELNRKLRHIH